MLFHPRVLVARGVFGHDLYFVWQVSKIFLKKRFDCSVSVLGVIQSYPNDICFFVLALLHVLHIHLEDLVALLNDQLTVEMGG